MIYEERQTLVHPQSAEAYAEFCKNDYWPALRALGGQPLCLLSGLIGDPPNQYLQITGYENAAAWEQAQAKIAPTSPDLVESESARLLTPISSRPKHQVPAEDRREVYGVRRFFIDPVNLREFVDSSEQGIWPRIESQGACILGLWTTLATTQPTEILLLTGYHSPSHWEETRTTSRQQTGVDEALRREESLRRDARVNMTQRTWVRLMRRHQL